MKILPAALLIVGLCTVGCQDHAGNQPDRRSTDAKTSAADQSSASEILAGLRQIGDAFQKFESVHGAMPPAAIFSPDGKPLLSWRVALLPQLNETALYEQFELDQPWDSEHNRQLLAKMPAVYAPWRGLSAEPPHSTCYQVFTGQDAPFNRQAGLVIKKDRSLAGTLGPKYTDFPDGTSQTFLVVEASEAVSWTKPVDLPYEAGKPLPSLGTGDRFYLLLADGSPHFMKKSQPADIVRGGITPRGQLPRRGNDGEYNERNYNEREYREPVLYSDARSVLDQE